MGDLSDKMRERLDKWRQNVQKVSTENRSLGNHRFLSRGDYGDDYEAEVILQEQRNRSVNGTNISDKTSK